MIAIELRNATLVKQLAAPLASALQTDAKSFIQQMDGKIKEQTREVEVMRGGWTTKIWENGLLR